jgi:hypothetical protein
MRAFMVSPTSLDMTLGELTGVDWASTTISAGYYTTTRSSASMKLVNGNWQRNTFVRFVYEIPEWDYRTELGTFLVSNDNATFQNGAWVTTLELHSLLFALDAEIAPESSLIQTDTSVFTPIKHELELARREYSFVSPNDYRFTNPTVLEGGNSRLTRLMNMCKMSNNRIDVDGHGRIILSNYVLPASKTPCFNLSLEDGRGIVFDGVGRSTNWLSIPNQAAVAYRFSAKDEEGNTYDDEIVAVVSVSVNSPNGANNRGYNITHYEEVSDMTPPTHARAQEIAQQNLADNSRELTEWDLKCKYIPVWEGDVITLDIPSGLAEYSGRRHCLVKNVELSGPYWDMSLTLKETSSGDEE